MALRKTRSPRVKYTLICPQCSREFIGFRSSARYCCDACRSAAYADKTILGQVRQQTYDRDGKKCTECGSTGDLVVRSTDPAHRSVSNSRVLCGKCNSKTSRLKFHENHPGLAPGYSRRVYTELQDASIRSR